MAEEIEVGTCSFTGASGALEYYDFIAVPIASGDRLRAFLQVRTMESAGFIQKESDGRYYRLFKPGMYSVDNLKDLAITFCGSI